MPHSQFDEPSQPDVDKAAEDIEKEWNHFMWVNVRGAFLAWLAWRYGAYVGLGLLLFAVILIGLVLLGIDWAQSLITGHSFLEDPR